MAPKMKADAWISSVMTTPSMVSPAFSFNRFKRPDMLRNFSRSAFIDLGTTAMSVLAMCRDLSSSIPGPTLLARVTTQVIPRNS